VAVHRPRALRRTFQDITRAEAVDGVIVRSISGHASREMQEHYSTAQEHEQRGALAKVVDLAVARDARDAAKATEGVNGGVNAMG
jgi:integrase